jgi:CheY-like chemotaxis protein
MESLLIVDDDPAIREVFSILLADHGYTVQAAQGGRECLAFLESTLPDLVLLDIMMYPVDGWETLAAIRRAPRTRALPAAMFSGKNPSADEIWQYGGWINDYLMKPITLPVITRALTGIFERCRKGDETRQFYLERGADPALVEEYLSLQRLLYIQEKFSREIKAGSATGGRIIPPQRARFEELCRLLSSGCEQDPPAQERGSA